MSSELPVVSRIDDLNGFNDFNDLNDLLFVIFVLFAVNYLLSNLERGRETYGDGRVHPGN